MGGGKGGKPAKEEKKAEEDELDLFGEDDPEDAQAAREATKELQKAADAAKKKGKPKPVAKSLVIWEVKPWGPDTDLEALGKKIISEIKMDGLQWKSEWKKEPVAYGVFKIVIGAAIEDEKVSADDVGEKI